MTPSRWSVSCWMQRASRAGALDGHRIAVHVLAVRDDVRAAYAVEGEPGDRQAALRPFLGLVAGKVQHGVDQVTRLLIVDVIGEHPQRDTDLRRGQADAGRVEHRLLEIGDQLAQFAVEVRHRFSRGAQHRVAEEPDWDHCHGEKSTDTGGPHDLSLVSMANE